MLISAHRAPAFALPDSSLNSRLNTLSWQMLLEGNTYFLLVQAVSDSLITANQPYDFVYKKDSCFAVNGKRMTPAMQQKYERMLAAFFKANPVRKYISGLAYRGGGINVMALFNPQSSYRKKQDDPAPQPATGSRPSEKDHSPEIVAAMRSDGLISGQKVHIVYDSEGIVVNNMHLRGEQEARYKKMFTELCHFTPAGNGAVTTIDQ